MIGLDSVVSAWFCVLCGLEGKANLQALAVSPNLGVLVCQRDDILEIAAYYSASTG